MEGRLAAIGLLAEIEVGLGDVGAAREGFLRAVEMDPEGLVDEKVGGGPEKFLWLAQLCEEGGKESVRWFERGVGVLRNEVSRLGKGMESVGEEKRKKLAGALCGMIEVYMTDLSWEEDAEATCERLIAEALMVAPRSAETLQTLANIRISQGRMEEAKKALTDSTTLWRDLPPEDLNVPDFPTRISLARLLMEVELEEDALEVVERLVNDDDQSVEAWYLGGWCLHLLAGKKSGDVQIRGMANGHDTSEEDQRAALVSSREWLRQSLKLFELIDYEDEKLGDHARELVKKLDDRLDGESMNSEEDSGGFESNESGGEDEDEDYEMEGT